MVERADANGYQLAYERLGEGEPTLVFHWGMLGDRRQFLPLAHELEDYGTRLVFDGRGYGESDAPAESYTLEHYADDVATVVRDVVGGPVVLIGQSMGAMTFLRLALRHPSLVAALVLIDTSAAAEDPEKLPLYDALLAQLSEEGPTAELLDTTAYASLMPAPFIEAQPEAYRRWRAAMGELDTAEFVVHARAVFDRNDISAALGEITAPTLVIVGSQDTATEPARSRDLVAGLGGTARLVELPGAGHFAAWEQPAETAATIQPFLDELGFRPSGAD